MLESVFKIGVIDPVKRKILKIPILLLIVNPFLYQACTISFYLFPLIVIC